LQLLGSDKTSGCRIPDVYLLRWILHDWTEAEAEAILTTLRRSMKPTARLIVAEFLIPEGAAFDFGK
jgi:O-methyltransferase domain